MQYAQPVALFGNIGQKPYTKKSGRCEMPINKGLALPYRTSWRYFLYEPLKKLRAISMLGGAEVPPDNGKIKARNDQSSEQEMPVAVKIAASRTMKPSLFPDNRASFVN
jgi:hypothetical protein|tara:strand:- start:237 stop:563 length:327 start_codon:yes stop_codon:yes gene_type:complete